MEWALAAAGVVVAAGLLVVIVGRRRLRAGNPAALANRILRRPERFFIDVPQFLAPVAEADRGGFLLASADELSRAGTLAVRRELLTAFAALVATPSQDTVRTLTTFLFQTAPQEFRDALSWGGKCEVAMRFLKLMSLLIRSSESGRPLSDQRKALPAPPNRPRDVRKELSEADRDVVEEWFRLFAALYRSVSPAEAKHKAGQSRPSRGPGQGSVRGAEAAGRPPRAPSALTDPKQAPLLGFLQKAALDVYREYRRAEVHAHESP